MTTIPRPAWAQHDTDLTGRTLLVLGGTGGVGEGVVATALQLGATVVATGRTQEKLDTLAARFDTPALHLDLLDALDPGLGERAAELAAQYGSFDGVVVSIASWGGGGRKSALSLTDEEWDDLIAVNLTAVFRLFRAFHGHVRQGGMLLQLNGMSADIPFPGAAGVALSAAATKSLTRTLAAESADQGPRYYQVILGLIRTRQRDADGTAGAGNVSSTDVGWHVAELVASTSPLASTDLHYLLDPAEGPRSGTAR